MITVRPSELCGVLNRRCSSRFAGQSVSRRSLPPLASLGQDKVDLDMSPYLAHYYDVYAGRGARASPPSRLGSPTTPPGCATCARKLGLQPGGIRIAFDLVRLLLRNVPVWRPSVSSRSRPAPAGKRSLCPLRRFRENARGPGRPRGRPSEQPRTSLTRSGRAAAAKAADGRHRKAEQLFTRPAASCASPATTGAVARATLRTTSTSCACAWRRTRTSVTSPKGVAWCATRVTPTIPSATSASMLTSAPCETHGLRARLRPAPPARPRSSAGCYSGASHRPDLAGRMKT